MPEEIQSYWIRVCQECMHMQKAKPPDKDKELTNSYRNSKCHKCHSEALDYGRLATEQDIRNWNQS